MIVVIDYGMGNLGSITKALQYVGADVVLSSDPAVIASADKIVLPGVGAFGDGMKNLSARMLIDVLRNEVLASKKPFLGVCLGMQLLAKKSYEFGEHEGLGWIDAGVKKLSPVPPLQGEGEGGVSRPLKVPHVGWNNVTFTREHPLLAGIANDADFYFVHSYIMHCADKALNVGTADYGGPVTAIIAKDNMFATQFHPEKSQRDGLQLLKNFVDM